MAQNVNIDYARLGIGHGLILGCLPEVVQLQELNKILMAESHARTESFGLFETSSPNYTTYYPDVTPEDLMPKPEDFINPVFRALSMVTVHKRNNPIDFAQNDVLRPSGKLLLGQTVNVDHETATGNAIGSVADISWEDEYTTENKLVVPGGINSQLKIDGKSNPRLARGILMDPPSIHSTSVTVEFQWEQSHPKMERSEFFAKLGQLDDKGVQIRRVVTKVVRYHEISLVNHGADPYAQLIKKSGQINNPLYAHISYNSAEEKALGGAIYYFDFKNLGTEDFGEVIQNSAIPKTIINNNNQVKNTTMLREFLVSLIAAYGLSNVTLADGAEPTQEQVDAVRNAVLQAQAAAKTNSDALTTSQNSVTQLTQQRDNLQTQLTAAQNGTEVAGLRTFQTNILTKLREETTNNYKLSTNTPSQVVLDSIANANYEGLQALNVGYIAQLDANTPIKCTKCGSKEVSRGSAKVNDPEQVGNSEQSLSAEDTMAKLRKGDSFATGIHGKSLDK